jgi:hypothetical protein
MMKLILVMVFVVILVLGTVLVVGAILVVGTVLIVETHGRVSLRANTVQTVQTGQIVYRANHTIRATKKPVRFYNLPFSKKK